MVITPTFGHELGTNPVYGYFPEQSIYQSRPLTSANAL
ncbi:Hypothetical protein CpMEX30_1697 [Corynebacterium pseudotuberculosis]|nr:Hypothetical protein CpE19_1629 [Corynebacterium pseudotuberculosis]APQ54709.1 Hypothetical protein CpMEX30_1697 [Corynebacterium pseudotuberculosis]APQ56787.1 Hypothetical protein CpMEX31_1687 [Corynebacterium pseudotuberculosis]ATB62591.1 Hypothetical protein BFF96_1717 [Corynebacterium pseudotuberculosis]ATV79440.1 Hypothetical protein BFF97_00680 [Corynebacterium pseudotuberculosis]